MIESKFLKELVDKPISGEWGDDGGNIKVLRTTNFTNERIIDYSDVVVRDIPFEKVETKKLLSGDLIIEKSGGSPKQPVGRVVYFDHSDLFLCNNFTSVLRSKRDLVFPKYLLYVLFANHQYGFTGGFQNKTTGIINLQLTRYIDKTKIPLPPLDQQKKIAAILDAADAYRQKTKALIEKYDELTQSLFLDVFGDPVTNPKGWEKGATINFADCIVPGRDKPKSFSGETPWITTADLNHLGYTRKSRLNTGLNNYEIEEVRARIIPKNSVIMTCVGDLGVVSINEVDIVMNQQLHAFICHEKINNMFLMHNLSYQTPYMEKMASSTTVQYMNKTVANNTPTIIPPISLQNEFADRVQAIEEQKAQAQASLAQAEDLFNSLLQRAFKGELV